MNSPSPSGDRKSSCCGGGGSTSASSPIERCSRSATFCEIAKSRLASPSVLRSSRWTARTVARSNGSSPNCPKLGPVELVGLPELVHEPDDLVRVADRVGGKLRRDDEVDGPLLRLLEVEKPPDERFAQRPRPGIPLERDLDVLDLVSAVAQLAHERLRQDLRAAPLERNLRRADCDPHPVRVGAVLRARPLLERLDARGELVDQVQHVQVEGALLCCERLDVPAHQLAQRALQRREDERLDTAAPVRADARTDAPRSPPRFARPGLSPRAASPVASTPGLAVADLLLQAGKDRGDLRLRLLSGLA